MINTILGISAALGVFLFALFRSMNEFQTQEDKEKAKRWYLRIWTSIDKIRIDKLPHRVINFFLEGLMNMVNYIVALGNLKFIKNIKSKYDQHTIKGAIQLIFSPIILFTVVFPLVLFVYFFPIFLKNTTLQFTLLLYGVFFTLIFGTENKPKEITAKQEKREDFFMKMAYIMIVILFSFSINILALFLGGVNFTDSWENELLTGGIVVINSIFDFLTIYTTYVLLKFILRKDNVVFSFILVLIDIILSGFFAIASLYTISLLPDVSISNAEIWNTLLGKSVDGNNWEFGKWFWLMHTTFIPTLIYSLLIIISLIIKIIILPLNWLLFRTSVHEKPNYAIATLFGAIGAFCGFLLAILKLL